MVHNSDNCTLKSPYPSMEFLTYSPAFGWNNNTQNRIKIKEVWSRVSSKKISACCTMNYLQNSRGASEVVCKASWVAKFRRRQKQAGFALKLKVKQSLNEFACFEKGVLNLYCIKSIANNSIVAGSHLFIS